MTQIASVSGQPAGVTLGNRAMVAGFGRDYHLACLLDGWAFTMFDLAVDPTGVGDTFAKLQNSSSALCYVTGITMQHVAAEVVSVNVSPAFASTGTHAVIVPVNRYSGSANLAATKAVCESDVDITGMTPVQIASVNCGAGTEHTLDLSDAPIILGPNQALLLATGANASICRYSIHFFFGTVPIADA